MPTAQVTAYRESDERQHHAASPGDGLFVGELLTLAADHVRGLHAASRAQCWRCEREQWQRHGQWSTECV